jgi:Mg/Co/Ni transporter MgtE
VANGTTDEERRTVSARETISGVAIGLAVGLAVWIAILAAFGNGHHFSFAP